MQTITHQQMQDRLETCQGITVIPGPNGIGSPGTVFELSEDGERAFYTITHFGANVDRQDIGQVTTVERSISSIAKTGNASPLRRLFNAASVIAAKNVRAKKTHGFWCLFEAANGDICLWESASISDADCNLMRTRVAVSRKLAEMGASRFVIFDDCAIADSKTPHKLEQGILIAGFDPGGFEKKIAVFVSNRDIKLGKNQGLNLSHENLREHWENILDEDIGLVPLCDVDGFEQANQIHK